jgi:ABC-type antimicrobial peptide transport system permease subunit
MTNADRIIRLEYFQDTEGNDLGGISSFEINAFLESMEDFEYLSLFHNNVINVMVNGHLHNPQIAFVNADFWNIYDFEFLYGRPFSQEDCVTHKTVVVITKSISQSFFNTDYSIGKKIKFQQREYEVIGIVKDLSIFATPTDLCTVWTPYIFNKFIPNGMYTYTVDLLLPPSLSMNEAKEKISQTVSHYFGNKNKQVDFPPQKIQTIQEFMNTDNNLFRYGGFVALLLFLLIPAFNILSFGITHTSNRAEEIAVRKTFGASRSNLFCLIMTENLILTVVGATIGLIFAIPVMSVIQESIMQDAY